MKSKLILCTSVIFYFALSVINNALPVHIMVIILFSQLRLVMLTMKEYCHELPLILLEGLRKNGSKHGQK